jgi:phytoene dehydrogenase-like protein
MADTKYDSIIIGSGINSLVAAAKLAKGGQKVLVLERNEWFGGNIRTQEILAPGFLTDIYSGFHPLFTTGPAWKEMQEDLERHGLEYTNTDIPTAVLLPDGRSGFFYRKREQNIAALNEVHAGDGDAYKKEMEQFDERQEIIFGLLTNEIWSFDGLKLGAMAGFKLGVEGIIQFLGDALPSARKWLDNTFESEVNKALFAPWVLHTGLGPDDAASALMDRVIFASFEQTGMPAPKGGGSKLVEALTGIIRENGGMLRANSMVNKILTKGGKVQGVQTDEQQYTATHVLANVTPNQLYMSLLEQQDVPEKIIQSTKEYRYGRANMQIHLALDSIPNWPDERLKEAAIVHITPGMNGVSRAVNEATRGLLPAEGTIVFGQHTALDPTRAPEGKWTVWIQLQELPQFPEGDALDEIETNGEWTTEIAEAYADRIINRIDQQLPDFKNQIIARKIIAPHELAQQNINLVNGDPYSGQASLDQLFLWRPIPELRRHETPIENLYHIGASTHPGPGLNGSSGFFAAEAIL